MPKLVYWNLRASRSQPVKEANKVCVKLVMEVSKVSVYLANEANKVSV